MRAGPGSAVRAWVVGHDGFRVGGVIAAIAVTVSIYAFARVPGPHGGPIPVWFLSPPALAMFAGLAVHNDIPEVGWSVGRLRRARLLWAIAVMTAAGLAAQLVGANAGQDRLGWLTVGLTGLTFGLATAVGRGSLALGASCLVVIVVSTRAVYSLTPAAVWDRLTAPGQAALGVAVAGCIAVYSLAGSRSSRAALTG